MNKRYQVRWYEFNLTEPRSRNFFTETGARVFAWYVETFEGGITKIYEI
jgi:hypothetical protein